MRAALPAILLLALPAPAVAATVETSSTAEVLTTAPATVGYALTLRTAAVEEVVPIRSATPFGAEPADALRPTFMAAGSAATQACPDHSIPPHAGGGPFLVNQYGYDVTVKADRPVTLRTGRPLRAAPWDADLATALSATFVVGSDAVTVAGPRYEGPRGVRMVLTGATPGASGVVKVARGSSVVLTGRVYAPVIGDDVSLLAGRRLIARTAVRADGTFAYRWHPRQAGRYRVTAAYRGQRPGFVSDRTDCSLRVVVTA